MKTRSWIFLLAFFGLSSCGGDSKSADQMVSDTVGDTRILKDAEAAANQIIRNAGDCDAISAAYSDVIAKLDEVEGQVQTSTGRTTITTLRKQVTTAAEACGVR